MSQPTVNFDRIPVNLAKLPQWVLWRLEPRDGELAKVPYQCNGTRAKAGVEETWAPLEDVRDVYERGGYEGIGFQFKADGGLVGIDLDGCRNVDTRLVEDWAREVIVTMNTYAEISPSATGVKLFVAGSWRQELGKKKKLNVPKIGDKTPAIEVYDRGRFFVVTGRQLHGPGEPQSRPNELAWLQEKYFAIPKPAPLPPPAASDDKVVERARAYLSRIPEAVSGEYGHDRAFHAACRMVIDFALSESDAFRLLWEWNFTCRPPWSERDVRRKIAEAQKKIAQGALVGRLRYQTLPDQPSQHLAPPPPKRERTRSTLWDAAKQKIESIQRGDAQLITIGHSGLDNAIGGGVEFGEYIVFAARPSHGKSAIALQGVHYWTELQLPTLFISQEMSQMKLGERAIQYLSSLPRSEWKDDPNRLFMETDNHFRDRAHCYVENDVASAEQGRDLIEEYVEKDGVRIVVVDYAQMMKGKGRDEIERLNATSEILRKLATNRKILIIALCQLNREIEKRKKFLPVMSDLKGSGQFEQDADVIVFQCWPWKLNPKNDKDQYLFFIAKNRNREIVESSVECRFDPSRMKILREGTYASIEQTPGFNEDLAAYNRGTEF